MEFEHCGNCSGYGSVPCGMVSMHVSCVACNGTGEKDGKWTPAHETLFQLQLALDQRPGINPEFRALGYYGPSFHEDMIRDVTWLKALNEELIQALGSLAEKLS